MTEKEFDQIRNSYYGRNTNKQETKESSGYFSYFKIRCLICIVIFLTVLVLDRQIDLHNYKEVAMCMQLLGKDEITIEECLGMIVPEK